MMPNKAEKAAETCRLSAAPRASVMQAAEMNPCMKVSRKSSLSLAARPSQPQPGGSAAQRGWRRPPLPGKLPGRLPSLLMPEILAEERAPWCQKERLSSRRDTNPCGARSRGENAALGLRALRAERAPRRPACDRGDSGPLPSGSGHGVYFPSDWVSPLSFAGSQTKRIR